ncbi:MAG: MarR family winged helix-turn-helix transcriptional regulator [Dehalococcoidia bacterium]
MSKSEYIECVVGLMKDLMLSARAREPHPWLDLRVTREQLRIMFLLYARGRSSPGQVATSFGVARANVTGPIDRLVKKGLVSRRENPADRRSCVLSLTEEGRGEVERLRALGAARMREVLEKMPDAALVSLRTGLEALVEVLSDGGGTDECDRSQ